MFLLEFIPTNMLAGAIHVILILGLFGTVLGLFLKYIPILIQYRIPIQVLSLVLLVSGVFFEGCLYTEVKWREKVAEVEERLVQAEKKSAVVNTVIEEKIVEKVKIVKEKVVVNHNIIQKQKEIINAECKVPDIAIKLYNNAIKNKIGDTNE